MIYALHGAVGSPSDWHGLEPEGELFKAVNLWRFLECCPMSLNAFGAALNEENTSEDSVLLGYSMGARLALHALLDKASRWSKAILVAPHTGFSSEVDRSARRSQDAEWASLALSGDWGVFIEKWNAQSVFADAQSLDRHHLKVWRKQIARSLIDWSTGAQEDLIDRLSEIEIPVLWLTGERDSKFTQVAELAVPRMKNARHVVMPGVGHRIPWEDPQGFKKQISDFLM